MSFSALIAAASGLQAYEMRFNDHAQNLASAGTVAGKARKTFLTSLKPSSEGLIQSASGVSGNVLNYISNTGAAAPSEVGTHIAIGGQGLMYVRGDGGTTSEVFFTRIGTLGFDSEKICRNHLGQYVQVFKVDPVSGQPLGGASATQLAPLDVSNAGLVPKDTTKVTAAYQLAANIQPTDLLPLRTVNSTLQVYDSLGTNQTLSLSFKCVDITQAPYNLTYTPTGTPGGSGGTSAWVVNISPPEGATVNASYDQTGNGMIIEFDDTGKPVAFRDPANAYTAAITPPALNVTWPAAQGAGSSTITLNLGAVYTLGDGADFTGIYRAGDQHIYKKVQADDGNAPGSYQSFFWDEDGFGNIRYSNGVSQKYCRLPLAVFSNVDGLTPQSNGLYTASSTSGVPTITFVGEGGSGKITPGSWEGSTTNGVSTYVDMIQDQKFYMGQLKVISAVKEMLDGLERL